MTTEHFAHNLATRINHISPATIHVASPYFGAGDETREADELFVSSVRGILNSALISGENAFDKELTISLISSLQSIPSQGQGKASLPLTRMLNMILRAEYYSKIDVLKTAFNETYPG